jgi:hypothetical protein
MIPARVLRYCLKIYLKYCLYQTVKSKVQRFQNCLLRFPGFGPNEDGFQELLRKRSIYEQTGIQLVLAQIVSINSVTAANA